MKVRIKLIATLLKHLPEGTQGNIVEIELPDNSTLLEAISRFDIPVDETTVIVLNGVSVPVDCLLTEGDTITAFSAIAGG